MRSYMQIKGRVSMTLSGKLCLPKKFLIDACVFVLADSRENAGEDVAQFLAEGR